MVESKTIRFIEKVDYAIDLEYNSEYVLVHLPRVSRFTKETLKDMLTTLDQFSTFFRTIGVERLFAAVDQDDTKVKKLLRRVGFVRTKINGNFDIFEKET